MKKVFELSRDDSQGKVLPLSEAIRQAIRPGMKLHVSLGNDPNAAVREIMRQFWGRGPRFTLIAGGVTTVNLISLIHCRLVEKVITSNCSFTYPVPRPIPLIQEAEKKGIVKIESWTLNSLEQRLMAGALGTGFMPTRSIAGSSLAEANGDSFKMVNDPFGGTGEIGLLKALEPDLALVHGYAADSYGNTILLPPYFTSLWGPRASKNGVIVTVEKLVTPKFIREHGSLVKIPGHLVRSVSVVPFGAHPQGSIGRSIGMDDGYTEDYDFIIDYQKASRHSDTLDAWLQEWVSGCPTQDDYLRKLGTERLSALREKAKTDVQEEQIEIVAPSAEPSSAEMMAVAAARAITKKVRETGHKTMLTGIGIPGLAAWLAYYLLREEGYHVDLLTGTGLVGYEPRPGDPFLMTPANLMTCRMLTDTVEVYGTFVGGAQNKCLSVLGAAQIDKYGNINTTKIDDMFFIGPGGAGDAINAAETLVVAQQSPKRLVEKVPFVTCPGTGVRTLVTNLGVFEKLGEDKDFTLTRYFAGGIPSSRDSKISAIKEQCGWDLRVATDPGEVAMPTTEELAILRSLDPQGFFIRK
ncbi:MAG: glutaconate CoA-transferase [Chloroflexi bacterium]|nr:glutaconate CoA-transferase [Chloroflexota bacterium]